MLRDFAHLEYLPFLSLRPAEMRALEELPNKTKDRILPVVHLRPWTTAYQLESGLTRLTEAYGERPTVVALNGVDVVSGSRPVHDELKALHQSENGFGNWCEFITQRKNFIPAVQLHEPDQLDLQMGILHSLGRGLVVIVERLAMSGLRALAKKIKNIVGEGEVCFVLDYGTGSRDPLNFAVEVVGHCQIIRDVSPKAVISVSASSFPVDFTVNKEQDIYERILFDEVCKKIGVDRLIYSDRGSARVERQKGGGGRPASRIDYPLPTHWKFYRSLLEGVKGYQEQAAALCALTQTFDQKLRVWGTLMIERTANGDTSAITTPARSTATRINLHLQRQAFYNDLNGLYDTEDDWDG